MKTMTRNLALASLFLLSAGPVAAGISVTFVHPEEYSDMPFMGYDRDMIIKHFADHFADLGKSLTAGQNLKIEVLDIDLAGRIKPNFRGHVDVRVLKDRGDVPRMHLRYTLEAQGKVLKSGDEQLSNMGYLGRYNKYSSGDPIRYEKQMIDEWFAKIAPAHAG